MSEPTVIPQDTLNILRENADRADDVPLWPVHSWKALGDSGVLRWCIPPAYGGSGQDPIPLLEGYELLASACLTTCFILSQRDAACRRLLEQASAGHPRELLAKSARG